jgi:hypothetical protein
MFAGPIGLVMLLGEWILLYFAWVHPWVWREQTVSTRRGDVGDSSAAEGDAGRIELGLLSQEQHSASDDHAHDDFDEPRRQTAAGALGDAHAVNAAQAAAIRALYDDMGPITRTQKVKPTVPMLLSIRSLCF